MSMDLTEPDAGSDLQSVMLKATFDEKENCWRLNGVKRFITNGDADLHLVLARSEEGTKDGRGLSMFIYDKRQGGVDVRRSKTSWVFTVLLPANWFTRMRKPNFAETAN